LKTEGENLKTKYEDKIKDLQEKFNKIFEDQSAEIERLKKNHCRFGKSN